MKKYRINYKSGRSVVLKATSLSVELNGEGNISTIHWTYPEGKNSALYLGVNNIESIWEL